MLERLGVEAEEIRWPEQLEGLKGLVVPGGESTAILRLMEREPVWWSAIPEYHKRGGVLFGTCAGLILLARSVKGSAQRALGLLDVEVARNAYGRQIDSFEGRGLWRDGRPLSMVFIRAPRITAHGPGVEILARHQEEPVLVRQANVLAASFHPELGEDLSVHGLFLDSALSSNHGRGHRPGPGLPRPST